MIYRIITSALLLSMLILLAGCSGSQSDSTAPDAGGTGGLAFRVLWPADARTIPADTQRIVVTAKRQLTTLQEVTINRPASTGSITGLAPGDVTLYARGYAASGALLASGSTSVTILSGQNVNASLTLTVAGGGGGGTPGIPGTSTKDNASLVWVPGNTFTMGTEYGNWWSPATQRVTLSGYWIYKNDVTVAQYRAFCTATGRALPPWPGPWLSWQGTGWDNPALQQHPIVNVTWYDAKAYADWAGVRLPTEAQWEYAARGPQGRNYPWGGTATAGDPYNGLDDTKCVNYYNSYAVGKSTWPVGSFPAGASWCGAQDMAGNVWQWCGDWYGDYSTTPVTNPTGPATGDARVLRGGSWYFNGNDGRGAFRYYDYPDNYSDDIGFRCASLSPGP